MKILNSKINNGKLEINYIGRWNEQIVNDLAHEHYDDFEIESNILTFDTTKPVSVTVIPKPNK